MGIDAARWARIQSIFHDALERPAGERRAWLEEVCAGDAELIAHVLALLEEDARDDSLLDRGIARAADSVLEAEDSVVRRIGPYRILRPLGRGGMGVVHLAERADLGSRAAIKLLRDAALSPARRDRFLTEQRTLAQLSHPSIARLYDADVLPDGTPYFVMEYVEGVALNEFCTRRALSLRDRLLLFRASCEAVLHAHRHAIVHRDIKPSNILVTDDGVPKLLDFGIAKQLLDGSGLADPTRTGLRLMTPAYAAPEQIRGDAIGVHTDVYALGVVLYELLTGRLPFELSNRTPGQVEAVLLEQEPEAPSAVAARTRPEGLGDPGGATWADLDVLCLTAMHKDPLRRYATVEALVRDVDRFLGGQPLEARPDTVGYRVGKFVRRNRRSVIAAAAVLTAVIGIVAFYTVRLASARDAALAEAARAQRIQTFMQNLFAGGDPVVGPADTLRVITLLDRGVGEARVLDGEPEVQAGLFATLGGLYQMRGDFERADSLLQAALGRRRALHGEKHLDVAESLVALGLLRVDQARLDDADSLVRQGLAVSQSLAARNHPAVLSAMAAVGRVLQERGDYNGAIAMLEETVRLHEARDPDGPELSADLSELANTHFYAGDYAASDTINRRVLGLNRALYGERHPHIADDLINLGAVQSQLGRYPEAERYYRDALEIMLAFYGPEHHETASNLTMLGRSLVFQRRLEEAEGILQRALATEERVRGPVHPRVASVVNELGTVALLRDDYDTAAAHYRRMIDIYRVVYGPEHYLNGIAISNLGSTHLAAERYAEAEPLFRTAIERFTHALSPTDLNTGIARIKLGRVLLRLGRPADAEVELRTGYDIVSALANPTVSWLNTARADLVIVYDSLGRPDDAERFRAEAAKLAASN